MKLYMKQKAFSLVDKYKIFDENQKLIYHVEGQFFSWRGKMTLMKNNQPIYYFSHRVFTFINRYLDIFNKHGEKIGELVKRFSFLTPRITVDIKNKPYEINGEIFAHNFTIYHDQKLVATVTKKWISWGDTYEIDINQEEDIDFIVTLVIGIDTTIHNDRYKSSNN